MPVNVETPIATSAANGVTTVFPYAFTVLQDSDLVVTATATDGTVTTYTLGVDYTVGGVGTSSGNVTFLTAPASGLIITRYRNTKLQRSTDYQQNGDLLSDTIDSDFDRLWLVLQESQRLLQQSVRVPETTGVATLPVAGNRENSYLFFDGNGSPTVIAAQTSAAVASTTPTELGGIPELVDIWIQRERVYPEQFGAKNDGGFYLTQLQRAINAATSRGVPVRGNGRTYKLDVSVSSLLLPLAGIEFEDIVLDISNAGANTNPITTAGALGNPITITAPTTRRQQQIPLSLTAGLVAGQRVLVSSSDFWSQNDGVKLWEWATIDTVDDATHVTFTQPLRDAYTTTPLLYAPTMTSHFIAERLRLLGGGNGLQQNAVWLNLIRDVRLQDSWTRKFANRGFQIDTCIKVLIDGGMTGEGDDSTGLSYGYVGSGANEQFVVKNITCERQRHGVTYGGTQGVSRLYSVENVTGLAMTDSTVDAHPAVDVFICRNVVHNGDARAGGADGDGIVSQARHTDISGYKVDRPGRHGILVQPLCSLYPSVVKIGPGEIKDHGSYGGSSGWGIDVDVLGSGTAGCEKLSIDDVDIESAAANANGILINPDVATVATGSICKGRVKTPGSSLKLDASTAAGKQVLHMDVIGGYYERTNTTAENMYAQGNSAGDVNFLKFAHVHSQGGSIGMRFLNAGVNYHVTHNTIKGATTPTLGITNNGTTQFVANNDTV